MLMMATPMSSLSAMTPTKRANTLLLAMAANYYAALMEKILATAPFNKQTKSSTSPETHPQQPIDQINNTLHINRIKQATCDK